MDGLFVKKLLQTPAGLTGMVIIGTSVLIALLGASIRPDPTLHANANNINLAGLHPGTVITELNIPLEGQASSPWYKLLLNGHAEPCEKKIATDTFYCSGGRLLYREFSGDGAIYPWTELPAAELNKILQPDGRLKEGAIRKRCFYLGTDKFGRDYLSRLLAGNYVSLSVGMVAVLVSLVIGVFLGGMAGYYGGWSDRLIQWFTNVIWSLPTLLLVIAITLLLGKGFWQIFIAVGLTMWVEVARITRGQVLSLREKEFVAAARITGYSHQRILFREILPNIVPSLVVISASNFATAILIEAGLSFLGVGVQPPMPSWGSMIKEHYGYLLMGKAYLALVPGMAISVLVFAFILTGNALRDALDVRRV